MRTIKFRAILNKEAQKNADDYSDIVRYFTLEQLMRGQIIFSFPEHWQFNQFTGFLDKNGKEIYEGDIISLFHDTQRSTVEWNDEFGLWNTIIQLSGGDEPREELLGNENSNCEVIGNIYSNPELLTNH